MPRHKIEKALTDIAGELEQRIAELERDNKLLEAQRLRMRTEYDMEMMREIGYCSGIENYSRHLSGRGAGERPATLIDFFPADFLTVIDESHVTLPQLRAMYNGDQARKRTLVEHGFRLPSALDNRPMQFEEFCEATGMVVFTTATPGPFERENSGPPVEQVIRPTGIVDPPVTVRPLQHQVDDLIEEVRARAERRERVLVTTLTKRTAEDLAAYLGSAGLRVKYLHSEIDAIERVEILRGLRKAEFDCLIGINLLREGLDLPEVSLVAILDADKEGFLRSETSLVQTAGRAARHVNGSVILYAEQVTDSMQRLMDITRHRREKQLAYNRAHNITPTSIRKEIQESLALTRKADRIEEQVVRESGVSYSVGEVIAELEKEMLEAADALEFERAAMLRDQLYELKAETNPVQKKRAGVDRKKVYYTSSRKHGKRKRKR
jgi:excinuclease ABC subunit B